jgi:tyrosyl-tRNA synthetase
MTQVLDELLRGTVDVVTAADLKERLELGRPLVVKAGFDPTRPDLHLGHVVLMTKMRQFQDFGHTAVFVVGDFTAQIGDPSGRSSTRPVLTREEIVAGAKSYAEQAFKILDPEKTKVVYNSEWLGRMKFDDVIRLASKYTLARMMERDDFEKRFAEGRPISIHELLYPLAQGLDSVELARHPDVGGCDVELGGTDQLFNLLVGRDLMREHSQKPQIVMTTPLLEGLSAREENGKIVGDKMSKSLDNYVSVIEPPKEQLGKLMSIGDAVMWRYYDLLSRKSTVEIEGIKARCRAGTMNPRDAKLELAMEIVTRFHDRESAERAREEWLGQFSRREVPDDMPTVEIVLEGDDLWLPKALAQASLVKSTTEGRRRIEAGAVKVDGEKVSNVDQKLGPGSYVVKAGKREWATIVLKRPS